MPRYFKTDQSGSCLLISKSCRWRDIIKKCAHNAALTVKGFNLRVSIRYTALKIETVSDLHRNLWGSFVAAVVLSSTLRCFDQTIRSNPLFSCGAMTRHRRKISQSHPRQEPALLLVHQERGPARMHVGPRTAAVSRWKLSSHMRCIKGTTWIIRIPHKLMFLGKLKAIHWALWPRGSGHYPKSTK